MKSPGDGLIDPSPAYFYHKEISAQESDEQAVSTSQLLTVELLENKQEFTSKEEKKKTKLLK